MIFLFSFILIKLLIYGYCPTVNGVYLNNPKLITQEGHLLIDSGQDRNITFRLRGSSRLNIGEVDVLTLVQQLQELSHIDSNTNGLDEQTLVGLRNQVRNLKIQIFGENGIDKRLQIIENGSLGNFQNRIKSSFQKVRRLETRVNQLFAKLQENNCRSNPCQNGGTCIDLYDNYMCKCPKNWEGPTCSADVNECAQFAGTDLGCQNGAVCVNSPGTYSCQCTAGWVGIHCTKKTTDCLQSTSSEMCGHGICVNTNVDPGYTCICEQGWKSSGITPACTVDIDECTESRPPCASGCINLPGSFTCASCPTGFTGNGFQCRDIDECAVNNGGCSTNPSVVCINTHGSFRCGDCPIGWTGDGVVCTRNDESNMCANNNICHPLATCQEVSNTVVCICPAGMTGYGVGANGCTAVAKNPCVPNMCQNGGACMANGTSFVCQCAPGFQGALCSRRASLCESNICQNGGTCVQLRRTYRCICTAEYRGRNCHLPKQSCSSVLTDESGILKYPLTSGYGHNDRCAWVIKTNETQVLNITFKSFDIEYSSDCSYDWLQVHDGLSSQAHLIGRFCGHELPKDGNIISTTNAVYLWFRSDNSTARSGFQLEWNSIDPICGGHIDIASHGTIASPGSPGNYPPNRDCTWTLVAPFGKRVQLTFFVLRLEAHETCDYDYLAVYEGSNTFGTLLAAYCNTTSPPPLITPGNEVTLAFHSDEDGSDAGFQLHYSQIEGTPGCGGVHTAPRGELSSPMKGATYRHDVVCEYLIQLPVDSQIMIQFTKFHLEESQSCSFDSLEIYEGKNEAGTLVGKWCGRNMPPEYRSRSNTLFIKFKTDSSNAYEGFNMIYNIACGGEFGEENGVITSPMYPGDYLADRVCEYTINAPLGKAIELEFSDFDLESLTSSQECRFDSLEIFDGFASSPSRIHCGDRLPPKFVSSLNMIKVRLTTDSTVHGRGFQANYTFINTGCGGVLKEITGMIKPPLVTSSYAGELYQHNADCRWVIAAPTGHVINLVWLSFSLEESSNCVYDFVEIYDNGTDASNKLGRFCGAQMPPAIISSGNLVTIYFKTDSSQAYGGFLATYYTIDARNMCGGRYMGSTGSIKSPGWPGYYEPNKDCSWTITVSAGRQIELNVLNFTLESNDNCRFDSLEIRNGAGPDSPLIGKYCGETIPKRIPSMSNQLFLKFTTDSSLQNSGFYIEWSESSGGCGAILTSSRGTITSPNYPQQYSHDAQCNWRIVASKGNAIRIIITDLQMEANSECRYDYLEVYDGANVMSPKIGRWCSHLNYPLYIVSQSNQVLVRMVTDSSAAARGFQLMYSSQCNLVLTELRGVIESPNYPERYSDGVACEWTIKAPLGNKISISFSHFELEETYRYDTSQTGCSYDWVEIYDEHAAMNKSTRYCNYKPPDITSQGEVLKITFKTDNSNRKSGFHMEYEVVGCGGVLSGKSGEITSPDYPNFHPRNMECLWYLEVPIGEAIHLSLIDMDIEASENCTFDGLLIANGRNESNPITVFCGTNGTVVQNVTSSSHQMFVKFYADFSYSGRGFKALYQSIPAACGGKFTTATGFIYSQNYPNKYESHSACEWLIELDNELNVNVTLLDLDTEENDRCSRDYLEIFEGSENKIERRLYKGCGNALPAVTSWASRTNQMLITFHTDYDTEYKGFKLQWTKGCQRTINVTEPGRLIFHRRMHCQWTLITQRLDEHITFTTTEVIFWDTSRKSCNQTGGIMFYDGDSTDAPLRASVCNDYPLPIISNGNALTIAIASPTVESFVGYYTMLDNACGGTINTYKAKFASPLYPESYPVNIQCIWNIVVSDGMYVEINISEMDIEASPHCNQDYLEVRERDASGKLLGIYCGNQPPSVIRAFQGAWIKFNSDNNVVGKGFLAIHNYAKHNEISGTSGRITSPEYPRSNRHHDTFSWRVTVERGYVIQLVIKNDISSRLMEYVEIYDGYDDTAVVMETDENTNVYTSNTNIVYITLNYAELEIEWRAVAKSDIHKRNPDCQDDSIVVPYNGKNFKSPGYPQGYPHNLNCSWIIRSEDPGTIVVLKVEDLSLNDEYGCYADYLKVSQSSDMNNWNPGSKICKREENSVVRFFGTPYLKVDFVTDQYRNGTGFNSTLSVRCGGHFSEPSGIINGTLYSTLFREQKCNWTIQVQRGKQILFSFDRLNLAKSQNGQCMSYVLIRNGIDAESPIFGSGRYCAQDRLSYLSPTISNRAYIEFVYDVRNVNEMELRYTAVSEVCGSDIVLTENDNSTTITSPNYPNIPRPHIECVWTIRAPAGHKLQLTFIDNFNVGIATDCTQEYVEVNDGGTARSQSLGKYCFAKPDTIYSSDSVMRIKYFTDITEPHNGFKAKISIGICGGSFHGPNGTITSNHFPRPGEYPGNMVCEYKIVQPVGSTINITFDDVHLPSGNCESDDNLKIYSASQLGDVTEETQLSSICGTYSPEKMISGSNIIVIRFNTYNPKTSYRGFKISFSAGKTPCGGNIEAESGQLTSLGYPNGWGQRQSCVWRIQVPKGRRIKLELLDVEILNALKPNTSPTRPGSKILRLYIYNDWNYMAKITFNNDQPPSYLYSSDNILLIGAFMDALSGHRGLKMRFSSLEPTICQGSLEESSGFIVPPVGNVSVFYCSYETIVASETTLAITHSDIIMVQAQRGSCRYGVFNVFLNKDNLYSVCKNTTQTTLRIAHESVKLSLIQSQYRRSNDIRIDFKKHQCGGVIDFSDNVSISLPSLPQNYGKLDCAWHLKKSLDDNVHINVTGLLNMKLDCDKEFIRLFNGPNSMKPLLGRFCGSNPLSKLVGFNDLYIEYHTDTYKNDSRMNLFFNSIDDCGGVISAPFRKIHFNTAYKNNVECIWTVHAELGFHIGAQFIDRFYIEESDGCRKDYLEIRDKVNNEWVEVARVCGRDVRRVFNSTGNEMQLIFRSDGDIVGDGFSVEFSNNCGGVYDIKEGLRQIMHSPNYPNEYPSSVRCNYTFIVPEDSPTRYIYFKFEEFDIEGYSKCLYDNFTIYNYDRYNEVYELDKTYCGHNSPGEQRKNDRVSMIFETDDRYSRIGFKFSYGFEECGGPVTNRTTIRTPLVESTGLYPPETDCIWNITAPNNQQIIIEFEYIQFESLGRCDYDFVEVFEGKQMLESRRKAKLCAHILDRPTVISIDGSNAIVHSSTDGSNEFRGFSANIYMTRKCNEKIILSRSNSTREYSFNNLEPNLDCHINVLADSGQQINIEFKRLHLQRCSGNRSSTCACDFIEVRDGSGPFAELLGVYCGHEIPQIIVTTLNRAYLRLVTDSKDSNGGFMVQFTQRPTVCGRLDYTIENDHESVTIQSPGSVTYPANTNCIWKISSPSRYPNLHFEKMDLQGPDENNTCVYDYVEIHNLNDDGSIEDLNSELNSDFIFSHRSDADISRWNFYSSHQTKYRFCGTTVPNDYYGNTNNILIKFKTDSQVQKSGFRITGRAATGCHKNYTGISGRIRGSKDRTECEVYIIVPDNMTISLYIDNLHGSYTPEPCDAQSLEIYDAKTSSLLRRTCSSLAPEDSFFSNTSQLRLKFKAEDYHSIELTYVASQNGIGCGGSIYNTGGLITSPMYPLNHRNNSDCRWDIMVPAGSNVGLMFTIFDLGSRVTCESDYLEIIEIENGVDQVARRFCDNDKPEPYKGKRNFLSVRFRKTVNFDGTGWVIHFASVHPDTDMSSLI